jgi:LPXTG-motif cell wall-anchored protein
VTRARPFPQRLLAIASTACLGLLAGGVGAVAVAGPASAQTANVSGSCAWDPDGEEWLVTWTITTDAPDGVSSYRLLSVATAPDGSPVDGIAATGDAGEFPLDADQPLVGEQRLPEGATSATLTVLAEWDNQQQQEQSGEVAIPVDCGTQDVVSQWSLDCTALTITVDNPATEDATLTFVPDPGEAVVVEVAGGDSATVNFPPSEGLAVDVRFQGRSVADPADPIEVTPEALAASDCTEDTAAEGGGGGLPATGTSTIIVVAGALVLLALGASLYLIARRRRIRFTA